MHTRTWKFIILMLIAMFITTGCNAANLPAHLPETGLIVDVTRFKGMSRSEIEAIAGIPTKEVPCVLVDPKTGEVPLENSTRGIQLLYLAEEGSNTIEYAFTLDTVEDKTVGMVCANDIEMIPFDGKSFDELLIRFGIKISQNAEITKRNNSWNIDNASDDIYNVFVYKYDASAGCFPSFQVMYYEEYN